MKNALKDISRNKPVLVLNIYFFSLMIHLNVHSQKDMHVMVHCFCKCNPFLN